jgi:hypothetical protein
VVAVLVADLVALGADVERVWCRPLAGDQVDVDGAAAGDGGEPSPDPIGRTPPRRLVAW